MFGGRGEGERVALRIGHVASETDGAIYLEVSNYYLPTLATNGGYSARHLARVRDSCMRRLPLAAMGH